MLRNCLSLLVGLSLVVCTEAQSYRFETILEEGLGQSLGEPAMNPLGVVVVPVQSGGGPERELWRIENGNVEVIVPASTGFTAFGWLRVAENGDVLFSPNLGSELWVWDESVDQLRFVADAAAINALTGGMGGFLPSLSDINESGKVAMIGGPSLENILMWDDGFLSILPGTGSFNTFNEIALADDGAIYAFGRVGNGWSLVRFPALGPLETLDSTVSGSLNQLEESGGTVAYLSGNSIWTHDDSNGVVEAISFGGSSVSFNSRLSIGSATGPISFLGSMTPGFGLFTGSDPSTDGIVQSGDCVTGGIAQSGAQLLSSRDAVDASGRVVFTMEAPGFPPSQFGRRVILATPDTPAPGQVTCDATQTSCPCGFGAVNQGCQTGCRNSTGGGAQLLGFGSASLLADDLRFQANGLPYNKPSLLIGGFPINSVPLGDGLLCASPSARLALTVSSTSGTAKWGPGALANSPFAPGMQIVFQTWYRDPDGPTSCAVTPLGYNLSNGYELTLTP